MKVAEEWKLPSKVVVCMGRVEKSMVVSKVDIDWLHCICSIANAVADVSQRQMNEAARKQQIDSIFRFFGDRYQPIRKNMDAIKTVAAGNLEKYCSAYGIDFRETAIGEGFFSDTANSRATSKEQVIEELQSNFLQSMAMEGGEAEQTQNPEIIFSNGMRDISQALLDDYQMEDIFTIIMETIYRGLRPAGTVKALLLIRNTMRPVLDVRLAMGDSTAALRQWFKVALGPTEEDIFNVSMQSQKEMLIRDSETLTGKTLLPRWLSASFRSPVFLMIMPIVIKNKPIGMIYMEGQREALSKIQPNHFHYLKVLRDQAVLAIRKRSGI
jgi:hypothetical protein